MVNKEKCNIQNCNDSVHIRQQSHEIIMAVSLEIGV